MASRLIEVNNNYVNLGNGPMIIQVRDKKFIRIITSNSTPSNNDNNYFLVDNEFSYSGSENVYVRSDNNDKVKIIYDIIS